jgi:hypothetical protein
MSSGTCIGLEGLDTLQGLNMHVAAQANIINILQEVKSFAQQQEQTR